MILWTLALGAVVTRLAPRAHAARATCIRASASEIEISVERCPRRPRHLGRRGECGRDRRGRPAGAAAGRQDFGRGGQRLDGRPLRKSCSRPSCTFAVLRGAADGAASLERARAAAGRVGECARLARDEAAATAPGDFKPRSSARASAWTWTRPTRRPRSCRAAPALIDSLEEAGAPAGGNLLGFWKLCWPPPARPTSPGRRRAVLQRGRLVDALCREGADRSGGGDCGEREPQRAHARGAQGRVERRAPTAARGSSRTSAGASTAGSRRSSRCCARAC